jgi:hypothetical protein
MILDTSERKKERKICIEREKESKKAHYIIRTIHDLTDFTKYKVTLQIQGGSNMTRTDLCVNKPHLSRSYLNHLVLKLGSHNLKVFKVWHAASSA